MQSHMVAIPVDPATERSLPADPAERQRILALGLREWQVRQALEACRRQEISLARAAEMAGVPLREMVPLAYAHGLTPPIPADLMSDEPLSLDEAADL